MRLQLSLIHNLLSAELLFSSIATQPFGIAVSNPRSRFRVNSSYVVNFRIERTRAGEFFAAALKRHSSDFKRPSCGESAFRRRRSATSWAADICRAHYLFSACSSAGPKTFLSAFVLCRGRAEALGLVRPAISLVCGCRVVLNRLRKSAISPDIVASDSLELAQTRLVGASGNRRGDSAGFARTRASAAAAC